MIKKSVIGLILVLLFAISCHKEDVKENKPTGKLKIEIGLYVSVNEIKENLKSTLGAEDFTVIIYNAADEAVLTFDRASDMPDEIQLETGNYYITAFSDNNLPAAFENPYYFGRSEMVTIAPDIQQTAVVNCELANTIVSVIYSDNVRNYFTDYITTVSSASGTLDFARNESRSGYFRTLPLSIRANLSWQKQDGTIENKTLTGTIPDPKPKRKYEIHVDASPGGGSALLMINLDETSGPAEIVDITDENQPADSIMASGDLLITEIMYDPTAISDAAGEWFELYNNTTHSVDLKNLVIRKNDTEKHTIAESIILPPNGYQVLARSETAVSGNPYLFGTAITLNNTGALLSVSNYGTDGTDGSIICSVNYGDQDFPSASGASISLDPGLFNGQQSVLGTSWCISASLYNTGDKGTPGAINDNCQQ